MKLRVVAIALLLAACSASPSAPATATGNADDPDATDVSTIASEGTGAESTAATESTDAPRVTDPVNDVGTDRPSAVTVTITSTSLPEANGSYHDAELSRFCGDFEYDLTGNLRAFDYGFPHNQATSVTDVTFHAVDLVSGATTSAFYLSVDVVTPGGQEPPSFVLQPGTEDGDSGTAQRTEENGTTTLTVDASNDLQHVTVTATCGPR